MPPALAEAEENTRNAVCSDCPASSNFSWLPSRLFLTATAQLLTTSDTASHPSMSALVCRQAVLAQPLLVDRRSQGDARRAIRGRFFLKTTAGRGNQNPCELGSMHDSRSPKTQKENGLHHETVFASSIWWPTLPTDITAIFCARNGRWPALPSSGYW